LEAAVTLVTLTLLAPAALEEQIADLFLAHEPIARAGFTTCDVRGHGEAATYQNVLEQVRGFTRLVEFALTAPESDIQSLLVSLKEALPDRGINYRILLVLASDTLR
jgi:hypothetical protein